MKDEWPERLMCGRGRVQGRSMSACRFPPWSPHVAQALEQRRRRRDERALCYSTLLQHSLLQHSLLLQQQHLGRARARHLGKVGARQAVFDQPGPARPTRLCHPPSLPPGRAQHCTQVVLWYHVYRQVFNTPGCRL